MFISIQNSIFRAAKLRRIFYKSIESVYDVSFGIGFSNLEGVRILTMDTDLNSKGIYIKENSEGKVLGQIDDLCLQPGKYQVDIGSRSGDNFGLDYLPNIGIIDVMPSDNTSTSIIRDTGGVRINANWTWC